MLLQLSLFDAAFSCDLQLNLVSVSFDTSAFIHAVSHAKLTHLSVVLRAVSGPIQKQFSVQRVSYITERRDYPCPHGLLLSFHAVCFAEWL